MTLRLARQAYNEGAYAEAICQCDDYAWKVGPLSLLRAAASISLEALSQMPDGERPIIIYTHSLRYEGAPIALLTRICRDPMKGSAILIATSDGPLKSDFEENNIPLMLAPNCLDSPMASPEEFEKSCLSSTIFLASLNPKMVFINTTRGYVLASACRRAGIRYRWWVHEAEEPFEFLFHNNLKLIAQSELILAKNLEFASLDTLTRYRLELNGQLSHATVYRPSAIRQALANDYHALDRSRARSLVGVQTDDFVIVSIGTICERKNQAELIRALQDIKSPTGKSVVIILVGDQSQDPAYYSELLSAIGKLCRSSCWVKVKLFPPEKHIAKFYACANIVVHTAFQESYCQVVMEAKHFGVPVVARFCDGMTGIVGSENLYKQISELRELIQYFIGSFNISGD
jgi:glycosyltransferase involved in cell wall biosynthesis